MATGPPDRNPFTDPHVIPALYADSGRVHRRSNALLSAKISGAHVGQRVADLLDAAPLPTSHLTDQHGTAPDFARARAVIADLGCGPGRPTRTIAQRFPDARLLAIDASPTMLHAARQHLTATAPSPAGRIAYLQADFHHLPLATASCDAITAVFSLYHATDPPRVLTEITRCLHPDGQAVLVTKSADSYRQLDYLIAATGLDIDAPSRPSLYAAADSGHLPTLAAQALEVDKVLHDQHLFRFHDAAHVAAYLVTVPKYHLPAPWNSDAAALAALLRRRRGDEPVIATSTITYVLARRRFPDH